MSKTIKEIKKHLGIGNRDIARAFGYKDANNFNNSTAKSRIEKGIEYIYEMVIKSKGE